MTKFVLVGCGASKRDSGRWPAKDLYTSTYFEKKREYAETVGEQWAILSAEHGLVAPDEKIRPYETSIDDLDEDEVDDLAHEVGMELIEWIAWAHSNGTEVEEIVVLAGKTYIDPLRDRETFHAGIDPSVVFPLQQRNISGIGDQMSWLNGRVHAADHQQDTLTDESLDANDSDHPDGRADPDSEDKDIAETATLDDFTGGESA